jgi:secreted trypsin-like serine protease
VLLRKTFAFLSLIALVACGDKQGLNDNDGSNLEVGILGGEIASQQNAGFSSLVQLYNYGSGFCSGALIDARTVVTAAHCLTDQSVSGLSVGFASEPGSLVGAESYRIHPGFVSAEQTAKRGYFKIEANSIHDIAIIRLRDPAPENASFAVLQKNVFKPGSKIKVTAMGYGLTGADQSPDHRLRRVSMIATVSAKTPDKLSFDQAEGRGVCHGDSGGPSFYIKDKKPILVGVVSHLDGVQRFLGKDVGDRCRSRANVTQIAPYRAWIQKVSQQLESTAGLY